MWFTSHVPRVDLSDLCLNWRAKNVAPISGGGQTEILSQPKKYWRPTFFALPLFLADRTNGRAIGTVLHPSSVTLCFVAKRCDLEQKLLLRAYRKSYMIPK